MKPWEETWTSGPNYIAGPESGVMFEAHMTEGPDRQAKILLVTAAPDMARALVEAERILKAWHKDRGEWAVLREQLRAALTKAGVPLP